MNVTVCGPFMYVPGYDVFITVCYVFLPICHFSLLLLLLIQYPSDPSPTLVAVRGAPSLRRTGRDFLSMDERDSPCLGTAFQLAPTVARAQIWACRNYERIVKLGDPAKKISELASSLNADTIVMGRKGLSDTDSNLGHVTTKVLSLTSKPVVLV